MKCSNYYSSWLQQFKTEECNLFEKRFILNTEYDKCVHKSELPSFVRPPRKAIKNLTKTLYVLDYGVMKRKKVHKTHQEMRLIAFPYITKEGKFANICHKDIWKKLYPHNGHHSPQGYDD
jgi:hypothetical protein